MFNSKDRHGRDGRAPMPPVSPVKHGSGNRRGMVSVIGPDMIVNGTVTASADLHIDGRVEGDVNCGTLAQGADSQIFGNITAETARLAGAVEGTVRVRQLTVERTARITGDVEYENITIENGGNIDGRLKHMSPGAEIPRAPTGPRAVESPSPSANDQAA